MNLSSIVNVNITRASAAVLQAGFGVGLIMGSSGKITGEKVREYADYPAVLEDFDPADPEAIAAQKYFGQEVSPEKVKIAQRDADQKKKVTVSVATLQNSTAYTHTINGLAVTFTSDSNATALEIAAGLVAAINGSAQAANVTAVDVLDGTYTVEADIAGVDFTSVLTANLSQVVTTANRNGQTELAAIIAEDPDWYALLNTSHVKADILSLASFVEATQRIYIASSSDSDIFTNASSDVMTALAAAAYDRTALLAKKQGVADYPEAAWAGRQLPQAPGSSTWAFKTLAGVTVDSLSDSEAANASNKGANTYVKVGINNITLGKNNGGVMASGEYIDVIIGIDYLTARIGETVYGRIINSEKIPFTNAGILVITEAVSSVLNAAIPDILADTPAPVVTAPLASQVSANDKANRTLTGVKFKAYLSGAIHKVVINGSVAL